MNAILSLIAAYGPTVARGIYDLVKTWQDKGGPTDEDWAALDAIVAKPLIDPGSPSLPPMPTAARVKTLTDPI